MNGARLLAGVLLAQFAGLALGWQANNPASPCYAALAQDSRFASIRDKVALGGSVQEMRGMAKIADRANAAEQFEVGAWRAARADCHKLEQPYYASVDVNVGGAALEHFAAVQKLTTALAAGTLTYGEFSRRRLELGEPVEQKIEALRKQILPPKPKPKPLQP